MTEDQAVEMAVRLFDGLSGYIERAVAFTDEDVRTIARTYLRDLRKSIETDVVALGAEVEEKRREERLARMQARLRT